MTLVLECIKPFGNFAVGDEVTVPDDIEVYDTDHFKAVDAGKGDD